MTAADPGPAPDLTDYDTTASDAAYEWFLSDHPWAVAERQRRRETHAARELDNAAQVRAWTDRTDAADLTGVRDEFASNLRGLSRSMRPLADRTQLRTVLDAAAPDDVWVTEERHRWETHMRVSGDGPDDYTFPAHLIGRGAAAYPPPPEALAGGRRQA